jgi:hypothetical protein
MQHIYLTLNNTELPTLAENLHIEAPGSLLSIGATLGAVLVGGYGVITKQALRIRK